MLVSLASKCIRSQNKIIARLTMRNSYQTYVTVYAHKLSFLHLMQITHDNYFLCTFRYCFETIERSGRGGGGVERLLLSLCFKKLNLQFRNKINLSAAVKIKRERPTCLTKESYLRYREASVAVAQWLMASKIFRQIC